MTLAPGRFDYVPINDRPIIRWPNHARVAFWVATNMEHFEYLPPHRPAQPEIPLYSRMGYCNRVGFWRLLDVRSGIPTIEAATVEQFVPQMLNYELIGGVDFQKGCYPGQEIVARSQYRGTIKRRMFLFECDDLAQPGQEVFHRGVAAQPAAMFVNASS